MVLIPVVDYIFGMLFFERLLKLDLFAYNPAWVTRLLYWLAQRLTMPVISRFSFWTFILGGLVFSFIVALISYPIARSALPELAEQMRQMEEGKKRTQPDIPSAPKHAVPFIRYEIPPKH